MNRPLGLYWVIEQGETEKKPARWNGTRFRCFDGGDRMESMMSFISNRITPEMWATDTDVQAAMGRGFDGGSANQVKERIENNTISPKSQSFNEWYVEKGCDWVKQRKESK